LKKKVVAGAAIALGTVAMWAGPAAATHSHVRELPNGSCVVLAQDAGEEDVSLPGAVFSNNPNVDIAPTTDRNHPLHVLLHKGEPGEHQTLEVFGSGTDPCLTSGDYVNVN